MADQQLTDEQLMEQEIKRRERFSRGIATGTQPAPKSDKTGEAGAPSGGWFGLFGPKKEKKPLGE